jgi:sarcosine oxidase subunit alpha
VTGPLRFTFEGRALAGRDGQSIGGALHAAGVTTLSWSAKYRRPRGLRCCSGSCPCCQVIVDGRPGVPACVTPLRGGEQVARMRPAAARLPLDRLARFAPAGFYYERFRRRPRLWALAERRRATRAGVAPLPPAAAGARDGYEELAVDVLVVGAGTDGLTAARDAARRGDRVLVADTDWEAGGRLLSRPGGRERARELAAEAAGAGAELRLGWTAIGVFEGGAIALAGEPGVAVVHPQTVHLATGERDRELAIPDGDLPGVLLAGAAHRLVVREGVRPGRAAVIAAAGADADRTGSVLAAAGVAIAAVCEPADVVAAHGRGRVAAVSVRRRGGVERVRCDTLVVALGRSPADELARIGPPA